MRPPGTAPLTAYPRRIAWYHALRWLALPAGTFWRAADPLNAELKPECTSGRFR